MVRSRLPQCLVALHPLVTNQDILHGVVQSVAHMQLSRDVWRGHYDGKGLFAPVYFCVEIMAVQPFLVQTVLNGRRIVGLFQFLHGPCLLLQMSCFGSRMLSARNKNKPSANPASGFAKGELTRGTTLFHRKFPALHPRRSSGLICAFNGAVRERLLPGPFQDSQAFWAFRLRSYLPRTPFPDCLSACGQSSLREAAVYSSSSQPFSILTIISV